MKNKILFILLLVSRLAFAVDASVLTKESQHTPFGLYLDPQEAYDLKINNPDSVLFLDVRNQAEIHYTGMATPIDANIPYRFDSTTWKKKRKSIYGTFKKPKNPYFSQAVGNVLEVKGLTKDSPIIIMCTSGSRAPFAARILHTEGFTKVYTAVEGFEGFKAKSGKDKGKRNVNGWKNAGLPWSYDLLPEKMYFNYAPK